MSVLGSLSGVSRHECSTSPWNILLHNTKVPLCFNFCFHVTLSKTKLPPPPSNKQTNIAGELFILTILNANKFSMPIKPPWSSNWVNNWLTRISHRDVSGLRKLDREERKREGRPEGNFWGFAIGKTWRVRRTDCDCPSVHWIYQVFYHNFWLQNFD